MPSEGVLKKRGLLEKLTGNQERRGACNSFPFCALEDRKPRNKCVQLLRSQQFDENLLLIGRS